MSRVEIVVGDLFDSDAPMLVVPCGVDGSISARVRDRVWALGVRPPEVREYVPGSLAPVTAQDGRILLFAMAAEPRSRLNQDRVLAQTAEEIGKQAATAGSVVAVPLLGTGAGGLEPEESFRVLTSGFAKTADPDATLRVHVLTDDLADRLSPPESRPYSGALTAFLATLADAGPLRAGAVIAAADGLPDLDDAGPVRDLDGHLAVVRQRWSAPRLDVHHLVLGLALDDDLDWLLLRSGYVLRLGAGSAWDQLSDAGRRLAEDRPLLASALGAPAEWSAELSGPITALAFGPRVDRIAALVGTVVYDVGADGRTRRVGSVDGEVVHLGWDRDGILALRFDGDDADIVRVDTGAVEGRVPGMRSGLLAGGFPAWLIGESGAARWWGSTQPVELLVPGAVAVLAAEGSGRRALIEVDDEAVLISTLTDDLSADGTIPAIVARMPRPRGRCVLMSVGRHVALAASDGSAVIITEPGRETIAVIDEHEPIDVLAANRDGHFLATACGSTVSVWPVGKTRPVAQSIAGYEPDSRDSGDLLEAERDAQALAALIASEKLRPPLAIGLFGEWGSGKTFVLRRLLGALDQFAGVEGYLNEVQVVEFNAWHYAETNLWASLVDQVLRRITSRPDVVDEMPHVARAEQQVGAAEAEEDRRRSVLEDAARAERAAKSRRTRQRLTLVGAVAVVAAGVVVTVVAGVGVWPAIVAGLAAAAGVVAQVKSAHDQAVQAAAAGRNAAGALDLRAAGRLARAAEAEREEAERGVRVAEANTERLKAEQAELRKQAEADPLEMVLRQAAEVTEYREQLSLVTRTRKLFQGIDKGFVQGRRRVVLAIDDLDRCPAEKVVEVLEAVHLLFSFEMFVVVLAVDTRWLEQSLKIRYHQLLGDSGSAEPADYLEKIIQIPVRLTPLTEGLVRQMITGLTGSYAEPPSAPVPAVPAVAAPVRPVETSKAPQRRPARMTRTRFPARLLETTGDEAAALSAVAPLVVRTPRTVKRFVNTYQILKARTKDPAEFHHARGGIGDHEVVAFLLAVVTGQPAAAVLIKALRTDRPYATMAALLAEVPEPGLDPIRRWLEANPRYGNAPSHRFAEWAPEVARFSFVALT
ncbi:P-loop NTPase fold protein [Actinoplanes sp. NBRC 103695]|uniref:KAP family P-loop NTPase fold protein n=1 Tax=Actinoplanes sp. NBRC 103695 TaxID=3032202 RepID=UPI0024A570F0|nr:P-loop NTPase fold protein [Actinoplanes sp. NBRC 103695]GLY97511.1 hypothetical protein Acsp02_47650 [Actinoplanes sp. NBRC 103695]